MPPKPEVLSDYLFRTYPGANYHSAYEAGFCGLWVHYQLCELIIKNIVVNPADIPGTQKDKLQKEDKRDSRKIAYALRSGNLSPIYTPTESTLNDRSPNSERFASFTGLIPMTKSNEWSTTTP